jgi:hypothetical protein
VSIVKRFAVYPFLLAAYPVLFLYEQNVEYWTVRA